MNETSAKLLALIDEKLALADAATKGPWYAHKQYMGNEYAVFITAGAGLFTKELHGVCLSSSESVCNLAQKQVFEENEGKTWPAEENADFITQSRTDMPNVLLALKHLVRETQENINGLEEDGDTDSVRRLEARLTRTLALVEGRSDD